MRLCLPVVLLVLIGTTLADEPTYKGKPLTHWIAQLDAKEPEARVAAVRALRAFGAAERGVLDALVKALSDPAPTVRADAASAIGEGAAAAEPAVEALGKALKDEDSCVRTCAAVALGKIGRPSMAVWSAIAEAVGDPEAGVAVAACGAIDLLPASKKDLAATATAAARSKSAGVRAWGLRRIAALGKEARDAEPVLIDALASDDPMTRRRAAEALGRIGATEDAIPPLAIALGDKDPSVVRAAIDALATFGKKACPTLLGLLQQEEGNTWQFASRAIAELGDKAEGLLPDLAKMLRDRDEGFRKRAASTLVAMGRAGREALEEAARDKDEAVRQTASAALAAIRASNPLVKRCDPEVRASLLARGGGSKATEEAVHAALDWLARHQAPDGGWRCNDFGKRCTDALCRGTGCDEYDVGVTGLALLAFLGAGHAPDSDPPDQGGPEFGLVVRRGLDWLVARQKDGDFGSKSSKAMYENAIAAYALAEASGMMYDPALRDAAQNAIDWLVAAQNPYKAWRYTPKCGENDTSVTGWCVQALWTAQRADLNVSVAALRSAKVFVDEITDKNWGKVGYQSLDDAGVKVVVPGKNEDYAAHEAMSAVGMVVRSLVDRDLQDPVPAQGARLLVADLPSCDARRKRADYYYWYYGTLALFQYDGPGSGGQQRYWKPWNAALTQALLEGQHRAEEGCADGSWDPDDRWGHAGGRVYATALNALTLETYYRFPGPLDGK